jgi:Flp pilus assembly protein TadD, contains TPR repeats
MKIKKILIITLIVISSMIYTNSVILGVGGSDDEDSNYLENVDADYLNGKELAYNGNYEDAIVYLKKSIETDPKNADAFNMLGYSNRKLGNNQEAFKYYNKSLKLDPRHKGSHEYRVGFI